MKRPKKEPLPVNSETGSMPTKPVMHRAVDLEEKKRTARYREILPE
jgi:hypothetical protein